MTALQIDTDVARRVARTWSTWGEQITAAQMGVDADIEPLFLGRAVFACSRLASAAQELWTMSGFIALLADRLEAIDGGAAQPGGATIDELLWIAGGMVGSPTACPSLGYSRASGEPGATFSGEVRAPYGLAADVSADPVEVGRALVMRALRDTATTAQIRKDEFELVRLTDGRYVLVLPGVIDLTHPGLGLDDSRSVRDLDQSAWDSSFDSSVAGNAYAQMVWDALVARGVPPGSEIVIVGHSFGADTALDLAADPGFNGPAGYDVSAVVAAGYHSQPQLADVPSSTRVLVLQNRADLPVLAEAVGQAGVGEAVESGWGVLDSALHLDAGGVLAAGAGAVWHAGEAGASAAGHVAGRVDDVAGEIVELDPIDAAEDLVLPLPGSQQRDSQVIAVFDGGLTASDGGHDQDRYLDYLEATSDPLVLGFLGSVAIGGGARGTAIAIDVSVPEQDRNAQKT